MSKFTAFILAAFLFLAGGGVAQAADATAKPAETKPELLVQGGLLGSLNDTFESVLSGLNLDAHLVDAWTLRAGRAVNELGNLVEQTEVLSPWRVLADFLVLSLVWTGAFCVLHLLGRRLAKQLNLTKLLRRYPRFQSIAGYALAFMLPAIMCLPLTLYVSHFMPASVATALGLCLAYATGSGIFSSSAILCVVSLFDAGHKRRAVKIIRENGHKRLFLMGFLAAISDALANHRVTSLLGGNITTTLAVIAGLGAVTNLSVLVFRLRRPVAQLIRNRPLAQRLSKPALQESLRIFSGLWYWPILLMMLVSAVHLLGAGEDSQKAMRCALMTTLLLIGTVFISTVLQHLFKARSAAAVQRNSAYKERLLGLLHTILRITLGLAFIELLGDIWGFSLFKFAANNAVGRAVTDSLSHIGLILGTTWLLWVVLDTAIQEALKPPINSSARKPSMRIKTILPLLRNAIKVVLVVICAITTMANLGINVAPLLAGAGVVGLAIGFGSQQLVQDVITGLFLIIEDTISVGDSVVLDASHSGVVESLTIRTLRLRDSKGFVHSVPFGQIKAVTNQSRQFAYAAFSVQFSYATDTDKAEALIRQVGRSISEDPALKHNLQSPLTIFGVDRMDLDGVVITAQFRTIAGGQSGISRAFNQRLKKLVDKTPDVHFAQNNPPAEVIDSPVVADDEKAHSASGEDNDPIPLSSHRPQVS